MFTLRCTVRNCGNTLSLNETSTSLVCPERHCFDRAKQGYWNLLQPQDRKSKVPGDSTDAVMARHRWIKRGHMAGLVDSIRDWIQHESDTDLDTFRCLDLGCGDGSFGPLLFPNNADGYCGIDLSKSAIKIAARSWPEATWVLANADRVLPATDSSVNCVVSLFGRRPNAEINRVLLPGAICIIAVPGAEDLIELREHVQQSGHRRDRCKAIIEEMQTAGMNLERKSEWSQQVELSPDAIADALQMTYRAVRRSQRSQLESISTMNVTLAADLMLFRKPMFEIGSA